MVKARIKLDVVYGRLRRENNVTLFPMEYIAGPR